MRTSPTPGPFARRRYGAGGPGATPPSPAPPPCPTPSRPSRARLDAGPAPLSRRGFLGAAGQRRAAVRARRTRRSDGREPARHRPRRRLRGEAEKPAERAARTRAGPEDAPEPSPAASSASTGSQARSVKWDIAPTGRDEWMRQARSPGTRTFRALVYQRYTAGFAQPSARPSMPGPTLEAEVGDMLVVHFRNADEKLNQAVTMHPHGVRYTPDYDGSYMGDYTRAGGFIAPGEEFTYTLGVHAGLGRRLALPRPRAEPHAQHDARAVRRDHRPREGRAEARRRARAVHALVPAAGHRAATALFQPSTAARTPATRRRSAPRSARTSPST